MIADGRRDFHHWLLVDPHRAEFHRHDPQDARPGLTWFRLPLFIWSMYATSLIFVLGTPVLAISLLLVAIERLLQYRNFRSQLGGDPVLFQHLFWFYSHPAVYIMVLPSMGVVSEISLLLLASKFSATTLSASQASRSPCLVFWSGGITCLSAANRFTRAWSFRF